MVKLSRRYQQPQPSFRGAKPNSNKHHPVCSTWNNTIPPALAFVSVWFRVFVSVCFVACLCAFVCTVFCSLKAQPHQILVCAEIGGDTEKWVGVLLASPADCAEPEKEQKSRAMTPTHPPSRPPTQAPGPGRRQLEAPVLCQRPRLPGTLAQRLQALQLRLASGD